MPAKEHSSSLPTRREVVWTAAAIGLALGAGLYEQSLLVLAVAIFLLIVLEKIESRFFLAGRNKVLHLVFGNDQLNLAAVKAAIEQNGFKVTDVNISRIMADKKIILRYSVKSPDVDTYTNVIDALARVGELEEFSMTD